MNGMVALRGEPAWLQTFMAGLEAQADAADGRITRHTTNTEDLTQQIVDTEARQRAQTALRDRLQELLRNRSGRLSDLLETERELARVQGEIDALTSSLAVMRTRVAMSELTLSYQSSPQPLRGDTFRPLGDALAGFLGIVIAGFAAIITIFAGLLPFAIVLIPIVWGVLHWRRARGGRFLRKGKADKPSAE
jgi:chromosome segregation ATPase